MKNNTSKFIIMKHTNFNMPTLRRITLFAILLLGTMPMWGEDHTVYVRVKQVQGDNILNFWIQWSGEPYCDELLVDNGKVKVPTCDPGNGYIWYEYTGPANTGKQAILKFNIQRQNTWQGWFESHQNIQRDIDYYVTLTDPGTVEMDYNQKDLYDSECGTPVVPCANCKYLGEE